SDLLADTPNMRDILNGSLLAKLERSYKVYKINELRLDRFELFAELLIDLNFMQEIGIKWPQYAESAGDYLIDFLRNSKTLLKDVHGRGRDLFRRAMEYIEERIPRIYSGQAGQERMRELIKEAVKADDSRAWRIWSKVSKLFSDSAAGKEISKIVEEGIAEQKFITLIDLSRPLEGIDEQKWDHEVKPLLIKRFLQEIRFKAEQAFYSSFSCNSLVVIDEAHRLAPASGVEDEMRERRDIRDVLVDSVRTTRKYGLGWMFISQTIQSLHKDIVLQLRTMFFGFGLGLGDELRSLREVLGGDKDWLRLYQSFKDPQSAPSPEQKEFPFMVVGPASPLSFSGTPLFFNAFTRPDEFLEANGLK
ncbi:MAG: ATPase, partial [Candidatus Hydrothermia bacterium]